MSDDKKNENQRDKDLMRSLARAQAALVDALGKPEVRDALVADLTTGGDSPFVDLLPNIRTLTLDAAKEVQQLSRDFRLIGGHAENWAVGALVRLISSKKASWTVNFLSNQRRCLPPFMCVRRPTKAVGLVKRKKVARKAK